MIIMVICAGRETNRYGSRDPQEWTCWAAERVTFRVKGKVCEARGAGGQSTDSTVIIVRQRGLLPSVALEVPVSKGILQADKQGEQSRRRHGGPGVGLSRYPRRHWPLSPWLPATKGEGNMPLSARLAAQGLFLPGLGLV